MWVAKRRGWVVTLGLGMIRLLSRRFDVDGLQVWIARSSDGSGADLLGRMRSGLQLLEAAGDAAHLELVRANIALVALGKRRRGRLRGHAMLLPEAQAMILDARTILTSEPLYVAMRLTWAGHYLASPADGCLGEAETRRRAYAAQRDLASGADLGWLEWVGELERQDPVVGGSASGST